MKNLFVTAMTAMGLGLCSSAAAQVTPHTDDGYWFTCGNLAALYLGERKNAEGEEIRVWIVRAGRIDGPGTVFDIRYEKHPAIFSGFGISNLSLFNNEEELGAEVDWSEGVVNGLPKVFSLRGDVANTFHLVTCGEAPK